MNYAIVYSSRTGNTEMLAKEINKIISKEDCAYFGQPCDDALKADLIFVGFWTDKGCCDETVAEFLSKINGQQIFLFGTAGFGQSEEYFERIIAKVKSLIKNPFHLVGQFMC